MNAHTLTCRWCGTDRPLSPPANRKAFCDECSLKLHEAKCGKVKKVMPETMNLEWSLAKLRAEIAAAKAQGENPKTQEACLSLGRDLARPLKPAVSYAEMSQPREPDETDIHERESSN